MSDQNPPTAPLPDAVPKSAAEPVLVPERPPTAETAFQSDAFLADKRSEYVRAETPSPAPIIKRGGVGFLTALLMSTIAAGGGAYLALFAGSQPDLLQKAGMAGFIPQPPKAPPLGIDAGNIAPLVTRIAAVEAELLSLKARLDGAPSTNAPVAAATTTAPNASASTQSPVNAPLPTQQPALAEAGLFKNELQGIGGRVTAIETRLAALDPTGAGGAVIAGLQADLAGLKAIIGTLQQQAAAAPSPAVTFAVVNLAEAANRPGPFLIEYETLLAAMPSVPEVAALDSFARTGVPTRANLQERFTGLAPALAAAQTAANKGTGIWAWFKNLFSGMVKVQSASDVNGTGDGAVLARAKVKLDQGDFSGSINDLASITTPPAPVTDWINGARKRVELESRISAVRAAIGRPVPVPSTTATGPVDTRLASPPPTAPATPLAKTQGTNP